MKKFIAILLITAILSINLVGCSINKNEETGGAGRFKIVERHGMETEIAYGNPVYILVDTYTNVMYLKAGGHGMTVLLNADGTPMLWEGK